MSKLSFFLLLAAFLSTPAKGGVREDAFLNLKSALQIGRVPPETGELLEYIFFTDHTYKVPKKEFCNFINLPEVKERAQQAVDKFYPRNAVLFFNFSKKIEPCRTAGVSHVNTLLRKMDFAILLFGDRAKENYLNDMKLHPAFALDHQLQYARAFLAEGNGERFEREINDIISKKKKQTPRNIDKVYWAYVHLANHNINLGNFEAAGKNLKMIPAEYLTKEPILKKEYHIVEFQKTIAEKLVGLKDGKITLPTFCDAKSDSFMRYRELEICLVADVLLNKKLRSAYLTELEPLLGKLFPIQVPQVALTLLALEDKGVTPKTDPRKLLADIELPTPHQTLFKFIFEYAKKQKTGEHAQVDATPVIKALGRYSLFGLVSLGPPKEQSGG